ncbi:hypothetical protein HDU93_000226 [Gonapodya sp. JEL0774]|nr:hypothetical protein HDU93_000226 [Gonapodya sp. JEL0774]
MGVCVHELQRMKKFYIDAFGFSLTDEGPLSTPDGIFDIAFLSRVPAEHHQIILASGRPDPTEGFNPIQQISLNCGSLDGVIRYAKRAIAAGALSSVAASHGNAISIYVKDPEGNRVELYTDLDWYIPQPYFRVITDIFEKPSEDIIKDVHEEAKAHPKFLTREQWLVKQRALMAD